MKVGDIKLIFGRPLTGEDCEGKAKILKIYKTDENFAYCRVKFIEDDFTADRRIKII